MNHMAWIRVEARSKTSEEGNSSWQPGGPSQGGAGGLIIVDIIVSSFRDIIVSSFRAADPVLRVHSHWVAHNYQPKKISRW